MSACIRTNQNTEASTSAKLKDSNGTNYYGADFRRSKLIYAYTTRCRYLTQDHA